MGYTQEVMPLRGAEINQKYLGMIIESGKKYLNDYNITVEKVKNSSAQYKGKPVPFLYSPMFFSPEEEEFLKDVVKKITNIGNKVTDKYIESAEYRKGYGFPKFIEEMILRDNKYKDHFPVGRFDIFYNSPGDFKFCELNTDGSSAMNEDNTIANILLESEALKDFNKEFDMKNRELFDTWVDASLQLYRQWKGVDHKPNVAIVDFVESGTSAEFLEFKKAYEKKGLDCIIADPRDLVYKDGGLYKDEYRIDLVYRRIVTFELIQKYEEVPDFIKAYMDDVMCTIGTIRSQVIHNKLFFKRLHDADTKAFLTDEENEFVKKHIPFTGILGNDENVRSEVVKNKDRYILKPMDMNASQGVYIGKDMDGENWKEAVEKSFDSDYLYQEFVEPPVRAFPVFHDGEFTSEQMKSIVGLFAYNGEYSGIYTRLSRSNIISGVTNYYAVPNIIAFKK
jgi:glutathionylspermidine synthase